MPHTGNRHGCALIESLATKQKSLQTGQIYSFDVLIATTSQHDHRIVEQGKEERVSFQTDGGQARQVYAMNRAERKHSR